MCGIAALWFIENQCKNSRLKQVQDAIHPRGPDHYGEWMLNSLALSASVLHLRGAALTAQPVVDSEGNVLLWNGEVFGQAQDEIGTISSDTDWVVEKLRHGRTGPELVCILSQIEGPWALIYYHKATESLYYSHDRLGRRSLLVMEAPDLRIGITSVAIDSTAQYSEVPCTGVFQILLLDNSRELHPWIDTPVLPYQIDTKPFAPELSDDPKMLQRAAELYQILTLAVTRRVPSAAALGVLFSGGLDSVVLAALAHEHVLQDEPIELLNVCFDSSFQSPDRLAAIASYKELEELYPSREWRFICVNVPYDQVTDRADEIQRILQPCSSQMDFNIGSAFWFLSRGLGAIDSFDDVVLSVDEMNAFLTETTRPKKKLESVRCPIEKCKKIAKPTCLYQVCRACCLKVQKGALLPPTGAAMEQPCKVHRLAEPILEPTPEIVIQNVTEQNYISKARVLLVGIGADEQLAGYGRHKTAYLKGGEELLRQELKMDMERIWKRNLGRDDRCISSHGREARFPYLDEQVVHYLQSLDLNEIADLAAPRGVGDKKILRLIGRHLGLHQCTHLAKRAIQFGSRIAKQTNKYANKSNRSARGTDILDLGAKD